MLMQQTQRRKRTRIDDVFDVIARYAETYPGSTPSQKQIAEELGLSQQRISYLLMRLEALLRSQMPISHSPLKFHRANSSSSSSGIWSSRLMSRWYFFES